MAMDDPKFISTVDAVVQFEKRLEAQNENDFVETGFSPHDQTLGRLRRGEIIFVGARPGMGKTAFLLAMALNQLKAGLDVFFFTLEMPIAIIMARLVSIETGIRLLDVIERRLDEHQIQKITGILPKLSRLKGDWSMEALLPRMEKLFNQIKPKSNAIVYVDFLGMIESPDVRPGDAYAITTQAAMALKHFAMQWEIPVVVAAQLNRQCEMRKDKHPMLSDFRDSGRLEEAGDVVLGLYRPGYPAYRDEDDDEPIPDKTLEVLCLKNKNGPMGDYLLAWDGECAHAWEAGKR
jgi:replicative DNA helicase